MKKLLVVLILIFSLQTPSYADDNDFYTWGFAGSDCGMFNMVLEDYGEEGDTVIRSAFQGFLTGYNLSFPERKHRIINLNDTDFLMNYMKQFCKREGDKGLIFEGLIKYYKALPYFDN